MRFFLPLVFFIVAGCHTPGSIAKNIESRYIGENINVAIDELGYPISEQFIAGRKVYTWIDGTCILKMEVNSSETVINYNMNGQIRSCAAFGG